MKDEWRSYFPVGSLGPHPDLDRDLAEELALLLERMEEAPLHTGRAQQSLVVRLLCLPTWSQACAVRVESGGRGWRLVPKEMTGEAGFEVGDLARRAQRVLSPS